MHRHHHHHHHSHDTHFFGGPRKGFGRGRFGGWFADGGELGGRGFGMGRKLASGDLQLLILELLAEKPRHGYEIIKALEERSKGFYVPSPGMVYPALTYLEEIGHASVEAEGTRKLYRATEAGLKHLAENRVALDTLLGQLQQIGRRMEKLHRAMHPDAEADEVAGAGEPQRDDAPPEVLVARYDLKLALAAKLHAPREEQLRIAEILRRAANEIRAK